MRKRTQGIISVEASIAIVLFLFCMLFFYGFFYMTMARNAIGHALIQTGQSMAMEAYESNIFTGSEYAIGGINDGVDNWSQVVNKLMDAIGPEKLVVGGKNGFADDSRWYDGTTSALAGVIKTRFANYMAGGEAAAGTRLTAMGVKDGLSGLDFSESYVKSGDLYIKLTYKIEPWFNWFDLPPIDFTMQTKSKLWGATGSTKDGGG